MMYRGMTRDKNKIDSAEFSLILRVPDLVFLAVTAISVFSAVSAVSRVPTVATLVAFGGFQGSNVVSTH